MRRLLLVLSPLTLAVLFAVPATPALAGTGQHAAITITSNAGFSTCGCVTSGSGTAANPFVIGPWAISAPSEGTNGWSVKVDNSGGKITDYFNIFGISSTYNNTSTTDPTIWLVDVAGDTFTGGTALDVASGGNGFYYNACAGGVDQPLSPVESAMGSGNTFANLCYSTTNIAGLLPSTCKS
jgi:hypothetical protein